MSASPSEKFNNILEVKKFLEECVGLNPNKPGGKIKDKPDLKAMIEGIKSQAQTYLDDFLTEQEIDQLSADNPDLFDDRNKSAINDASVTSSKTSVNSRPRNNSGISFTSR